MTRKKAFALIGSHPSSDLFHGDQQIVGKYMATIDPSQAKLPIIGETIPPFWIKETS